MNEMLTESQQFSAFEPNLDFQTFYEIEIYGFDNPRVMRCADIKHRGSRMFPCFLQTLAGRLATWPEFPSTWPRLSALAAQRLTIIMGKLNRILRKLLNFKK